MDEALLQPEQRNQGRILSNPTQRRALRADFPALEDAANPHRIVSVLQAELEKHGTTLQAVPRITLAYPHKHPDLFPGHYNSATAEAWLLQGTLRNSLPGIQWLIADAICETRHLRRSENQTSIHALMVHQIYDLHKPSQTDYLPFLDASSREKEYFVVVDASFEQGTTLANLISYIEHNGGNVLMATVPGSACPFAQQKNECSSAAPLSEKFTAATENNRCLPELAASFAAAARSDKKNWTANECLEMFEERLNKAGNSVFALTHWECKRLIETVGPGLRARGSFTSILKSMDRRLAENAATARLTAGP